MQPTPTLGALSSAPPHRSFFRDRLQRLAGDQALDDWLVEEANVRGYLGATGRSIPDRPATSGLSDVEVIVALLMPQTPVDGRLFKLVVRMLQRTEIDGGQLWFCARRERADRVLYWLLNQVPATERTGSVATALAAIEKVPRGYQGLRFRYDSGRLLRRAATKESVWRAARR